MADKDSRTEGERFAPSVPPPSEPYFLKGSSGLDWGMQSRLARVFRPATGRTVMLAIDHGYFQGPTTGLERVDLSIVPLLSHADALMTTRGMVRSTIPPASGTPIVLRASGAVIPASDTMNWVKNSAAMAGAICVIACIVAPTRPSEFGRRALRTTPPVSATVAASGWAPCLPASSGRPLVSCASILASHHGCLPEEPVVDRLRLE